MSKKHPHFNSQLNRYTLAEGDSILYTPTFGYMVDGFDEEHRDEILLGRFDISAHVREHAQSIALDASNGDGEREAGILVELLEDVGDAIAYIKAWAGYNDDDEPFTAKPNGIPSKFPDFPSTLKTETYPNGVTNYTVTTCYDTQGKNLYSLEKLNRGFWAGNLLYSGDYWLEPNLAKFMEDYGYAIVTCNE